MVAAAVVMGSALATPSLAQDGGVNGHGFALTAQDGDVRDPLTVERPGHMTAGDWYGSVLFEFNDNTMDQLVRVDGGDPVRRTYLDNMFGVNIVGGVAVHDMLRIDIRLPTFFSARGYNANDPSGQPIGGGFGNLRAGLMFAPLTPGADGGFGLGVVPWLDLPTATASKNMGYGGLSGGTKVAATVEAGQLTVGADVGVAFRPKVEGFENIQGADQLVAGLGAGFAISPNLGVNLEANFNPSLAKKSDVPGVPAWSESPSEMVLSFKGRTDGGLHLTLGGATALSPGVGAARYRVFLGGGFGKISQGGPGKTKIGDMDKDGIADDVDACPNDPETLNDYKDGDGCPDELGSLSVVAKQYYEVGPDLDVAVTGMGDTHKVTTGKEATTITGLMPGAYDVRTMDANYEGNVQIRVKEGVNKVELEVQATTPGTLSVTATTEGGDAIGGALVTVAAPGGGQGKELTLSGDGTGKLDLAPGYYSVFVQADGYGIFREDTSIASSDQTDVNAVLTSARTEVKKERIDILEKVFFQQGSAVIQARSFPLLDEVSNVLLRNSDIRMVEVAGHTSSEGSLELNNQLSKDRANAVRNYLIERGVAASKLMAVGYGPSTPLVPEQTEADRAKNRRVEFVIRKRTTAR
jgi:outer membrane protein OmpA-like peptidoglycan-associated protein